MVEPEVVTEFVNNAHGNLARVRELLAARPELLNERSALGESALAAAAHVGNREIARFLIDAGAPLDICTAAMLADREKVASFLEDPAQARAQGAHRLGRPRPAPLPADRPGADVLEPPGRAHLGEGGDVVDVAGEVDALGVAAARDLVGQRITWSQRKKPSQPAASASRASAARR